MSLAASRRYRNFEIRVVDVARYPHAAGSKGRIYAGEVRKVYIDDIGGVTKEVYNIGDTPEDLIVKCRPLIDEYIAQTDRAVDESMEDY